MTYNSKIHHRRSIRLKDYGYSQFGSYFVTLCVQGKQCLFGNIKNDTVILSPAGEIALKYWIEIPDHFPPAILDEFVVMPNHLHGIICIQCTGNDDFRYNDVGARLPRPYEPPQKQSNIPLGKMIAYYKYISTKFINALHHTPGKRIWQRNYAAMRHPSYHIF